MTCMREMSCNNLSQVRLFCCVKVSFEPILDPEQGLANILRFELLHEIFEQIRADKKHNHRKNTQLHEKYFMQELEPHILHNMYKM